MKEKFSRPTQATTAPVNTATEAEVLGDDFNEFTEGALVPSNASPALTPSSASDLGLKLKIPYLNLSRGGKGQAAKNKIPEGSFYLGDSDILAVEGTPLEFIILRYTKFAKEALPQGTPLTQRARTWASREEALADGMSFDWVGSNKPTVNSAMDMSIIIRQPDGLLSPWFVIPLDGSLWAPALWTVDGLSYALAERNLDTNIMFLSANNVSYGTQKVSVSLHTFQNGNTTWKPTFQLKSTMKPETYPDIEAIRTKFNVPPRKHTKDYTNAASF